MLRIKPAATSLLFILAQKAVFLHLRVSYAADPAQNKDAYYLSESSRHQSVGLHELLILGK
jgi:hypothetical protein